MILESASGNEVRTARKSAIPTQKMAGAIIGKSLVTYNHLEQQQDNFTIGDLEKLYKHLGTDGKDTLAAWVQKKFTGVSLETLNNAEQAIR